MTRKAGAMEPEQIIDYLQQHGEIATTELYGLDLLTWAVGLPHLRHKVTYDVWAPEAPLAATPGPAAPDWDLDIEFAATIAPLVADADIPGVAAPEDPPAPFEAADPDLLCPGDDHHGCGRTATAADGRCWRHRGTWRQQTSGSIRGKDTCPGVGDRRCGKPTPGTMRMCRRCARAGAAV